MLVGTPVVASDSGGHPEVLENGATGILVPADNVDAFVGAVASLLRDPPGARVMVAQAEQRARARFSVVRHASQMLSVYRTGKAEDVITKPKVSSAPTSH
jgi:glycosyltransferase involved in cell wall biosynthesis